MLLSVLSMLIIPFASPSVGDSSSVPMAIEDSVNTVPDARSVCMLQSVLG
jgi:hypothetical protein